MKKTTTKNTCLKWTLRDLTQLSLVTLFLLIALITLTIYLFGEGGPWADWPESTANLFLYGIQTLTLLVPIYLFTRIKYNSTSKDFGLIPIRAWKLIKNVIIGFLLYYLASAIFLQLQLSYDIQIPGYGEQESHIPIFGESLDGMILGGIIIVFIAPIVEELFFRGYLYQIMRKYVHIGWASVLSASIFALFHLEFQVFIPIFILGLVLNWLFQRSGSLWTPIAFHMVNNAFAFFIEISLFYEWIEMPL